MNKNMFSTLNCQHYRQFKNTNDENKFENKRFVALIKQRLMTGRNCDEVWVCLSNSWISNDMQKWEKKPTELKDVHAGMQ